MSLSYKLCPYRFYPEVEDKCCIQDRCLAFQRTNRESMNLGEYLFCHALNLCLLDDDKVIQSKKEK